MALCVAAQASPVARIQIMPASASLQVGETLQFEAQGYDGQGHAAVFVPLWSVSGGGVIDRDGRFQATEPGRHTVTAKAPAGNAIGVATVTVRPASRRSAGLRIEPSASVLAPGEKIRFRAQATGPSGAPVAVDARWSATGGEITPGGLYRAGAHPGYYRVVVQDRRTRLKATAVVRIVAP